MKLPLIALLFSLMMISGKAQNRESSQNDKHQQELSSHPKGNKEHQHKMRGGQKKRGHHGRGGHRHHKGNHRHHHSH